MEEFTSVEDLVRAFGEYALEPLTGIYPDSVKEGTTLKDFLKSVDGIIQVEVPKLYPDAGIPEFTYEEPAEDQLVMIYKSPRNLPALVEGVIDGAAKSFGQEIQRIIVPIDDTSYRDQVQLGPLDVIEEGYAMSEIVDVRSSIGELEKKFQRMERARECERKAREKAEELFEVRSRELFPAGEELRMAEENYRGIFENVIEGIYQTTPEGKYLSVNPALAHM